MLRLRTDLWVAGYLRRVMAGGAYVAVRRRGVPEAGAIFITIDHLSGVGALYGPAPQSVLEELGGDRRFTRLHKSETLPLSDIEARLTKEVRFDHDLWIVDVEDKQGRSFLDGDLS